jgi:hypothetical protein
MHVRGGVAFIVGDRMQRETPNKANYKMTVVSTSSEPFNMYIPFLPLPQYTDRVPDCG